MLCPRCNMEVNDGSVVCTNCGNVLQNPNDNKNYVGMNRVVLSEQPPAPQQNVVPIQQTQSVASQPTTQQPVEQQIQPVVQAVNVEPSPVQTQVVGATTSNVQQTVQPNVVQPQQQNEQINQTTNAQQVTDDKIFPILGTIVTVICALICLYFLYTTLKDIPDVIKLASKYSMFRNYAFKTIIIDLIVIAVIIFLSYSIVYKSNTSYVTGLIIGAICITIVLMIIMIMIDASKYILSLAFFEADIIAIIIFYNAYFISKLCNTYITSKLYILDSIKQMIVATGISLTMYYISYKLYISILKEIVMKAIAKALGA